VSVPGKEGAAQGGGRKFYLQARLGAGAFGEVYLAEQDSGAGFTRRVALKVLNTQVAGFAEAGRRMRDEARILGRLSHRNIVTVLDLVYLGNQWAVVMDYVPGVDLERAIEALERTDTFLPPTAALEIGAAVLEALHAAYYTEDGKGGTLGVVHRDIKPSNVLLTRDGDVKVLDFGVARVNLETRESKTGLRVGTERYMSPQRICGDDDGASGDVYAAAASIAELVLRRPIGRTPVETHRHTAFVDEVLVEMQPLLEAPDELRDEILGWFRRALHVAEAERPSARELADAFLTLSRRLPGEALVTFARRFVPDVDRVLEHEPEPMEGVLSEASSRTSDSAIPARRPVPPPHALPRASASLRDTSNETLNVNATLAEDPYEAPSPKPRLRVAALVGLVALCSIGVVGTMFVGVSSLGNLRDGVEEPPAAATGAAATRPDSPPEAPLPPATPVQTAAPAAPEARGPPADEPDAVPVEAAMPAPPRLAPTSAPTTSSVPPAPAPSVPVDAPRVGRALVSVPNASAITVTCGDVAAQGTASVSIRNFPAGSCVVRAEFLGRSLHTEVGIDQPREVHCTASGDALSCT
jgi:serine/threonine protein kinase